MPAPEFLPQADPADIAREQLEYLIAAVGGMETHTADYDRYMRVTAILLEPFNE